MQPSPDPGRVGDVPARTALLRGGRTAIFFNDERISHDDLARRAARLAAVLRAAGVGPGERVALAMENRPDYIVSYFGVCATGAALVPLNTFLATTEAAALLDDAGCRTLIASSRWLAEHAAAVDRLRGPRRLLIPREDGGALPEDLPPGTTRIDWTADPADASAPSIGPDDPAVVIYTSGTTGIPKGVVLSHRNLLGNARGSIAAVGAGPRDRIIVALPLFHSFTQMVGMLAPILAGMSIVLCEKLDRAEVKRALVRRRPTIFPAVPAVFNAMSAAPIGAFARWLNPVKLYVSGGAPLPLETLRAFERNYRRPLCEGYGLSEAGPVVSLSPRSGPRKEGSVGRPIPGVSVRTVDAQGRDTAPGEPGELLVSGPGVMKEYLNRPEETRHTLCDGWLRTGDQARIDADGEIFIVGRNKDMLIFRGMNIYPREIEGVLESHPAVREAAVVGRPDTARGEIPWAFVSLRSDLDDAEGELRRFCIRNLARYKVPRGVVVLSDLPRSAQGKVLKNDLRLRITPPGGRARGARGDRGLQGGS